MILSDVCDDHQTLERQSGQSIKKMKRILSYRNLYWTTIDRPEHEADFTGLQPKQPDTVVAVVLS